MPAFPFLLLHFFLYGLLSLTSLQKKEAEEWRNWTDISGRSIEARLVEKIADEQILIEKKSGQRFPLKLTRLSEADRQYVAEWQKPTTAEATGNKEKSFPPMQGWPDEARGNRNPSIEVVKEGEGQFIYRSPHFEFHSDARLNGAIVREFSRLFEATYEAVLAVPLKLDPAPPEKRTHFLTELFSSRQAYIKAGGLPNSSGTYLGREKKIIIPFSSLGVEPFGSGYRLESREDNATVIHETVHQLMDRWLAQTPVWLSEGAAEFFASAKYNKGRFSFAAHHRKLDDYLRKRKGVRGREISMVPPEKLMTLSHREWASSIGSGYRGLTNYSSAALLFYYFCRVDGDGSGKTMYDYFNALRTGKNNATAQKHLLKNRTYPELEEEIKTGLRSKGFRIVFH